MNMPILDLLGLQLLSHVADQSFILVVCLDGGEWLHAPRQLASGLKYLVAYLNTTQFMVSDSGMAEHIVRWRYQSERAPIPQLITDPERVRFDFREELLLNCWCPGLLGVPVSVPATMS